MAVVAVVAVVAVRVACWAFAERVWGEVRGLEPAGSVSVSRYGQDSCHSPAGAPSARSPSRGWLRGQAGLAPHFQQTELG